MDRLPTNRNETSRQKRAALPDAVIDALFARLLTMYGAKWLDQWHDINIDAVKGAWAEELADVTPPMLQQAMNSLDSPFPPTLPAFRALCRAFRQRGLSNVTLLAPPRDRERAKATLRTIHQLLHMPDKPNEPAQS